ncbi:hypothetical protein AB0K51_20035, partial [Kitasatospora sp. NPDC049285]
DLPAHAGGYERTDLVFEGLDTAATVTLGGVELIWTVGLVMAGYALGSSIPNVDHYLLPIVAVVVVVSLLPLVLEVLRSRRHAKAG